MEELKPLSAEFLKKRGTCCKTACLHCPYGHTLKKLRLQFKDVTEAELASAQDIAQNKINLEQFKITDYKFILLKEHICGVIRIDKLFVREMYLHPEFEHQGLDRPLVESYYFC